MKDAKAIVSSSGSNFPLDAPCGLELDCGNGVKFNCETRVPSKSAPLCSSALAEASMNPLAFVAVEKHINAVTKTGAEPRI